ncbi:MAG: hypothetical protein ACXWXO_18110 [Nocardioides sp.]
MSTTRIRAAIVGAAATAMGLSGALAGCSVSRDDEPEPRSTSEPTNDPEPTDEPSTTVSPSEEPSASASASTTGLPTPEATLLAAADLPQLNDTSPWTEGTTDVARGRPFGLCQQFDMLSIGAMSAVERTYTARKDTAGQIVAEFPDAQNAVRASKVIEAWHGECRGQVKGTNVKVRPITDVAVPRGKGWWYLVSFERRGTGHFHSLGMVLSGARMTLIRMDHDGQDHNYKPGQDPVELAVKAVSARLG